MIWWLDNENDSDRPHGTYPPRDPNAPWPPAVESAIAAAVKAERERVLAAFADLAEDCRTSARMNTDNPSPFARDGSIGKARNDGAAAAYAEVAEDLECLVHEFRTGL